LTSSKVFPFFGFTDFVFAEYVFERLIFTIL